MTSTDSRKSQSMLSTQLERLGITRKAPPAGEARYRHLLDHLDQAVLLADPASGEILEANARAVTLTGLAQPQLIGRPLGALLAHPAINRLVGDLTHLAPDENRTFRRVTLTGRRHTFVDVYFSLLVEDDGRRTLYVLLSDVSELLRLDNIAAQHGKRLTSLGSLAAMARAGEETGLDEALSAALALLSSPAGALYALSDEILERVAIYPPAAAAQDSHEWPGVLTYASAMQRPGVDVIPLAGGEGLLLAQPASREHMARTSEQSQEALHAATGGALSAVISAWQARTRAQDAVLAYERTTRTQDVMLDLLGSGVILLDTRGLVIMANRAASQLLGYEKDDVLGMPYNDVLVARQPIADWIAPALAGRAVESAEFLVITREGQERPVRLAAAPVPTGTSFSALLVLDDLSRQKEKDEQLRELDRQSFLGEVSPVLAHEIRNPLTSIQAGVQYMAGKVAPGDPLHDTMMMIVEETRRLNVLLADFLATTRPVEPRLMPCFLPDLLDNLLSRKAIELQRRNISVRRDDVPDLPSALADPPKLEQVFANLVDNAMQAMGQDGVLTVRCELAPATGGAAMLRVSVADTGPGIAPDMVERIFQPFYTTKKGGTGLGLPISRRIVNAHNGSITVENLAPAGTIFSVTLPALRGS